MSLRSRFQKHRETKKIAATPHLPHIQHLINLVGETEAAATAVDPWINDVLTQAENWQSKSHADHLRAIPKKEVV